MSNLFLELTIVLVAAGVLATVISFFKQPAIIAYLLTGLIVGPIGYYRLQHSEALQALAEIGITLLLFLVGLELDISSLKKIGHKALLAAIGQILGTAVLGFAVFKAFGFENTAAGIMAAALTFSSTVIVIKLLNEKKDLHSLYGKITVAILLLQDFAAIGLLIFFSGANSSTFGNLPVWQNLLFTLVKAAVLVWLVRWLSIYVMPLILKITGRSQELLLVLSLAWALGLAALVSWEPIGFNVEIGGFLAGLALAQTVVHYEIDSKIKSLRDFFIIIFFITLGSTLVFNNPKAAIVPALLLAAFVLIVKPFVVIATMSALGFKSRTSFFTALNVSQISEFSLIIVALGVKSGYLTQDTASLLTLTAIITMAVSSYFITSSNSLFSRFRQYLSWFDWRNGIAEKGIERTEFKNHVIIAGAHRLGRHIVEAVQNLDMPFIVIDHNPEVTERYREQGVPALCGDITDTHIQDVAGIAKAKLIISTLPDPEDNRALLESIRKQHIKAKVIMTAFDEDDALSLYKQNIDYALLPHFVGGQHLAALLSNDQLGRSLTKLKQQHIKALRAYGE